MVVTISKLLKGQPHLTQLGILMDADKLFPSVGRYYGGPLTEEQTLILTPKDEEPRKRTK